MERLSQEELKAYLMQSSEEFRTLAEKHAQYKRMIEVIEAKPHLTPADEVEEHRIKKLKLRVKDEMQALMNRHQAQQSAA